MADPLKVSASDFAGKFGHWSFAAQTAPVMVTDQKTGAIKGYFISAREFEEFARLREQAPRTGYVWEMLADMADELQKPLPKEYPDLDHLLED